MDLIKADINDQPGERDSETVSIYATLFFNRSPESLLKFVTILNKIIRGHDLSTGPQKFGMSRNLVVRESLRLFEHKTWDRGTKTKANYEFPIKHLITHLFPPKALQHQKRYLQRGIYNPCNTKIRDFIYRVDEMVYYIEKLPTIGINQGLLGD